METDVEPRTDEQKTVVVSFLEGLLDSFGVEGEVTCELDEDVLKFYVDGDDLGRLIGPRGTTLQAIQEVTRTVVQRRLPSGTRHRMRIDIGRYWEKRRNALSKFVEQQAAGVRESGVQRALEAMGAADRKTVHDTVNEMEGVATMSEGEEPNRRVVITPT